MDNIEELKAAIKDLQNRLHEEMHARTELERRCHLLEKLAYRDPTTGLRTEAYLHARVREEILRSIRYPSSASLVTICAPEDRSDRLVQLGMRLTDDIRESDQVFSLSQSGLALLLVETPREGAQRVIDRISADLERFISGYGFAVTSFPVDANLADDFIRLAMERHAQVAAQMSDAAPRAASSTFH